MEKKKSKVQKKGIALPKINVPKVDLPNIDVMKAAGSLIDEASKSGSKLVKSATKAVDNTHKAIVKAIDQNGDGELNFKDIEVVKKSIDKAATNIAKDLDKKKLAKEKKELRPVFVEDLDKTNFYLTKLIRLTDMDKRHKESAVCKGAIGHLEKKGNLDVVYVYKNKLKKYGITLYPNNESDIYYVDPSDRDNYIALEDYFDYLKVCRINELQKIAQDLGAKHFKVTYKEEVSSDMEVGARVKTSSEAKMDTVNSNGQKKKETIKEANKGELGLLKQNSVSMKIAAEMECPGHAPTMPQLRYLKNDPNIQTLIDLRMDELSPISHQKFTIQFNTSSGIKVKDAIQIDEAIVNMKINFTANIAYEANSEKRKALEYEIDF